MTSITSQACSPWMLSIGCGSLQKALEIGDERMTPNLYALESKSGDNKGPFLNSLFLTFWGDKRSLERSGEACPGWGPGGQVWSGASPWQALSPRAGWWPGWQRQPPTATIHLPSPLQCSLGGLPPAWPPPPSSSLSLPSSLNLRLRKPEGLEKEKGQSFLQRVTLPGLGSLVEREWGFRPA